MTQIQCRGEFTNVKKACFNILDAMLSEGESDNFYIGFVAFGGEARKIGDITNIGELSNIKKLINQQYGTDQRRYIL